MNAYPTPCTPLLCPVPLLPKAGDLDVGVGCRVFRSLHFIRRAELRHIDDDVIDFVVTWGEHFFRSGMVFQTVLYRQLPIEVRNSRSAHKAKDCVLCCSHDGDLVTGYYRKNAVKHLKGKPKNALSASQLEARKGHKGSPKQVTEHNEHFNYRSNNRNSAAIA